MTNLQNLSLFPNDAFISNRYLKFLEMPLGQLYQGIPFKELADLLPKKKSKVGAPSWFGSEGLFGLMFLKAYTGLSDEKLINSLNTDWAMQFFCGIQLKEYEMIHDTGLPSRIRLYLAEHIEIEPFQKVFIKNWRPEMENIQALFNDATAYESYIKYPMDVKLLWDCTTWIYETMHELCKSYGLKRPRSKYNDQKVRQLSYQKSRQKSHKRTNKRKKALLYLLNKGIGQLNDVLKPIREQGFEFDNKQAIRFIYIKEIYRQQKYMFENHVSQVANRIVSLFKPYIRPIVRGKENKRVEFGAKACISQVDGINFIDKLSFDAFNEAKELKNSIRKHKQRFGKCSQLGVDAIYGTNENRKYTKRCKIFHSMVRKGKASKYEIQEKVLRRELGKERSTVLEGSFGNEKNHYGLAKIKARTEQTEIIWILFGVMTANAARIVKRRTKKVKPPGIKFKQLSIAA